MVAKLVHYTGTVQGVGFRFTARNHARRHRITGYVNNLRNGQVELLAEGDDTDVKEFLADSQFVIITHSRRTMNIADVIYGVTMQEQGVSKKVAVRFAGEDEDPELSAAS